MVRYHPCLEELSNFGCLKFWFFWLSIWWMTTQSAAFDNPCLCWEKNAHACEVYFINYVTVSFFYFYYPSNIFQHTRKMFINRLLFMVCQCSLKWFCEQKKHFPSIAMLFILNQIFNTEFSILDVRFENWEISLAYPPVLARGYSVMWYV